MDHARIIIVIEMLGIIVTGIIQEILSFMKVELGNTKIGVRPRMLNQLKLFGEFGA